MVKRSWYLVGLGAAALSLAAVILVALAPHTLVSAGASRPGGATPTSTPSGFATSWPATPGPATPGSITPGAPASGQATHSGSSGQPGSAPPSRPAGQPISAGVFFDDFSYGGVNDPRFAATWSARSERGGPGQNGATWSPDQISFAGSGGATVMTLTATTGGTGATTRQSEVDSRRAVFFDGTYATRIRFTDEPTGTTGAHVNETVFTISAANGDDPRYSEMDFEYLPAGGWGDDRRQLDFTTWASYDSATDTGDSQASVRAASFDGWHILVMRVVAGVVTYYVDGSRMFSTTGRYYPRESMELCFNEWFIDGELGGGGAVRGFVQQVDWTYYAAGQSLTPAGVQDQVDRERAAGVAFTDTVGR